MAYVERRRNVRVTEEKDTVIGRFGAQFVSCALILCICAGCKYSGLFPNKVVQLKTLITYNTDASVIKDKISSFIPSKPFTAPLKGTITNPFRTRIGKEKVVIATPFAWIWLGSYRWSNEADGCHWTCCNW